MKIVVGSPSDRKAKIVKTVFSEYFENESLEIIKCNVSSEVPETPWNGETFNGAHNRAKSSQSTVMDGEYYVGLESGLVERYGYVFEEVWCCIIDDKGSPSFGYSSGLKLPDYILTMMESSQLEHYEVMDILDKEEKRVNNDDTWGTYTKNLVIRDVSLQEAIRNALVQIVAPEDSYYKK